MLGIPVGNKLPQEVQGQDVPVKELNVVGQLGQHSDAQRSRRIIAEHKDLIVPRIRWIGGDQGFKPIAPVLAKDLFRGPTHGHTSLRAIAQASQQRTLRMRRRHGIIDTGEGSRTVGGDDNHSRPSTTSRVTDELHMDRASTDPVSFVLDCEVVKVVRLATRTSLIRIIHAVAPENLGHNTSGR